MSIANRNTSAPVVGAQRGMALLVSLVFLLLLTLIGIASIQNATLQEKMAGSVKLRNESFQVAEAALRAGETAVAASGYSLAACAGTLQCAPPSESTTVAAAGANASSGVIWVVAGSGFYGAQNIGRSTGAVHVSGDCMTLYRVTGVGLSGGSRTVLESIHAKHCDTAEINGTSRTVLDSGSNTGSRRIVWRQIQ